MNLDTIINHLSDMSRSGDPDFSNYAQYLLQMITQLQNGEMSPSEAAEILTDLERQLDIIQDMERLSLKETMNMVINALITIARTAA